MNHRIHLVAGTICDTRKLGISCGVVVACWTIPGAVYCVLHFDPWLAPGLFSSGAGFLAVPVYAVLAIVAPLVLLPCGLSLAEGRGGWRWLTGWIFLLVMGFAYEVFAAFGLKILGIQLYYPAHKPWILLGAAAGFLALALALAAMLIDAPRATLAGVHVGARTGFRSSLRTRPGQVALTGIALAVLVVAAFAGAGLRAGPGASVPANGSTVVAVAFSPDGRSLAVADGGHVTIQAVDPRTGVPTSAPPYVITNADTSPFALAFSPGRHALAFGGMNENGGGEVELWDTVARRRVLSFADPVPQAPVRALAFTADGAVLAAGDDSGVTSLWDARTGRLLARLGTAQLATGSAGYTGIDTLAFSPDGSLLVTVTHSGGVTLWRTATWKEAGSTLVPSAIGAGGTPAGGTEAIAFSDGDDYRITIAVGRHGVYLWDASTGRVRTFVTWPACQSCISPVVLSPDGNYALVGGTTAQLWDLSYSSVAKAWADPAGYPIASAALSPAGPVAFGDTDGGPLADVTFPAAAYLRY
jgi:hypothetical protein